MATVSWGSYELSADGIEISNTRWHDTCAPAIGKIARLAATARLRVVNGFGAASSSSHPGRNPPPPLAVIDGTGCIARWNGRSESC
jgi:hypothetical protein